MQDIHAQYSIEPILDTTLNTKPGEKVLIRFGYVLSYGFRSSIAEKTFENILNCLYYSSTSKEKVEWKCTNYFLDGYKFTNFIDKRGNRDPSFASVETIVDYSDWIMEQDDTQVLPSNIEINFKTPLGIRIVKKKSKTISYDSFPPSAQYHHGEFETGFKLVFKNYDIHFMRKKDIADNIFSFEIFIEIKKEMNSTDLVNVIMELLEHMSPSGARDLKMVRNKS